MTDIKVNVTPAARVELNVNRGMFGPTGPAGATGPTGPQGQGVALKGSVATVGDLPSTGNVNGDSYIVTSNGHLYTWNNTTWVDDGPFVGPTGPTGTAGPTGPQGEGLQLTGSVATPQNLPSVGQPGDQYFVQSTNSVYIWSNT